MKSIVILYNDANEKYKNEKIFSGKSALETVNHFFDKKYFRKCYKLSKIGESE